MATLATAAQPSAMPFSRVTYYPYRVTEMGNTYPLIVDCGSLKEAVERGKVHCFHKDHLLVREVDNSGDHIPERLGGGTKVRLHLYAIKRKSAPRYVYRGHVQERVHDLYAAPVCVVDASMFAEGGK
jgi:hypothetical protein